ncbi:hypothetical protein ACVWXO_001275 [Bradyrhizobium sp. LM2.7]
MSKREKTGWRSLGESNPCFSPLSLPALALTAPFAFHKFLLEIVIAADQDIGTVAPDQHIMPADPLSTRVAALMFWSAIFTGTEMIFISSPFGLKGCFATRSS